MKSTDARQEFERLLAARGVAPATMTPRSAIDEMALFYRDHRAEDCDIESDGDMLQFQWGTYDWGHGPTFDYDITRQLYPSGDDEDIWQLHVTFSFEPSEGIRALGSGNRWCSTVADLGEFLEYVRAHPVFAQVADRTDVPPEIDYECAG